MARRTWDALFRAGRLCRRLLTHFVKQSDRISDVRSLINYGAKFLEDGALPRVGRLVRHKPLPSEVKSHHYVAASVFRMRSLPNHREPQRAVERERRSQLRVRS